MQCGSVHATATLRLRRLDALQSVEDLGAAQALKTPSPSLTGTHELRPATSSPAAAADDSADHKRPRDSDRADLVEPRHLAFAADEVADGIEAKLASVLPVGGDRDLNTEGVRPFCSGSDAAKSGNASTSAPATTRTARAPAAQPLLEAPHRPTANAVTSAATPTKLSQLGVTAIEPKRILGKTQLSISAMFARVNRADHLREMEAKAKADHNNDWCAA